VLLKQYAMPLTIFLIYFFLGLGLIRLERRARSRTAGVSELAEMSRGLRACSWHLGTTVIRLSNADQTIPEGELA
jgi:hypothetical protein